MNKSKRKTTVTWGAVILGAVSAVACGTSPDWQNQYTEEPSYSGGSGAAAEQAADASSPEDSAPPCATPSPTCNSALSTPPASSSNPGDPQGNPDPVPWALDPIVHPMKTE